MNKDLTNAFEEATFDNALETILRQGARRLLQQAIEAEVAEHIEKHQEALDSKGHRLVVRNGYLPERSLQTGMGPIEVKQPRVKDRREGQNFSSSILPRYARRAPSIENVIPTLYLKGVSTGDFSEALEAILGKDAPGLSASSITRLKKQWEQEDLSGKRYVYLWADGIYFTV